MLKSTLTLVALGSALSMGVSPALADLFWDINDTAGIQVGAGTWSTGEINWNPLADGSDPRVVWTNGQAAFFTVNDTYTVTVSGTPNASSINFNAGTVSFTGEVRLNTGGSITVNAGAGSTAFGNIGLLTGSDSTRNFTNNGSGTLSMGSLTRISASSNHSLVFAGGSDITVSSVGNIGGGSITKNGGGTLTVSGRSSPSSGVVTVNGGVLNLAFSTNLTTATGATALTIANNATLRTNHNRATGISNNTHGVTLGAGGGTFEPTGATTLTLNGIIAGIDSTRQLTKAGTGTLVLGGVNTYLGNTTVNDGVLQLSSTGELRFDIENSNVSNRILGGGTVSLDGIFRLDIATLTDTSGTWNLVNVATLTESYGSNFNLAFVGGPVFDVSGNLHTSGDWTFDRTTGNLTLGVIPEPASLALLAVGSMLAIARRRRA